MPKFKVGQEVRLRVNQSRESDFKADLLSCLRERDISGRTFDTLTRAIEDRKIWTIRAVQVGSEDYDTYEIQTGKTVAPFMVEQGDLEEVAK